MTVPNWLLAPLAGLFIVACANSTPESLPSTEVSIASSTTQDLEPAGTTSSTTTPERDDRSASLDRLSQFTAEGFGEAVGTRSVSECLERNGITIEGLEAPESQLQAAYTVGVFGCAPDELAEVALERSVGAKPGTQEQRECVIRNQFQMIADLDAETRQEVLQGKASPELGEEFVQTNAATCNIDAEQVRSILASAG